MVDVGAAVGPHLLGDRGRLDLDHLCAQHCQQLARVGAGPHFRELDDAHPVQWAAARSSLGGLSCGDFTIGGACGVVSSSRCVGVLAESRCGRDDFSGRCAQCIRDGGIRRRTEHRVTHLGKEAAVAVLWRLVQIGGAIDRNQRHTHALGVIGGSVLGQVADPLRESLLERRDLLPA